MSVQHCFFAFSCTLFKRQHTVMQSELRTRFIRAASKTSSLIIKLFNLQEHYTEQAPAINLACIKPLQVLRLIKDK